VVEDFKQFRTAEICWNRMLGHPDSVAGLDWNGRLV